jgi:hypothetical protein
MSTGAKNLAVMLAAAGALFFGGLTQAVHADSGSRWADNTGWVTFVNQGGGQWTEFHGGKAAYNFEEVQGPSDCVSLYDSSRRMGVRIYDQAIYLSITNFSRPFMNGSWR